MLYGERGLFAIEVKRTSRYSATELSALRLFRTDYPMARCFLFYGGHEECEVDGIRIIPLSTALPRLPALLR